MRVAVDWNLCLGSGLCVAAGGRAFALVETADGPRAVLADPTVDDAALLAAARACPTLAIVLSDAAGERYPGGDVAGT